MSLTTIMLTWIASVSSYLTVTSASVFSLYSNIEYVWKFIKGSICHAMDLFIPKVKLRSSKHPRWFNSDIRHHLNCLHSLRRKVKVHPSKLNLMKIKSSVLQEKILSAKKLYESKLTQNFTNMNMLYKYINSVTHQDSIPSTIAYGSSTASSDHEKASLFNQFFHSVITQSPFILPHPEGLPMPNSRLSDISFSDLDVYSALTTLNPSKAMGIDGIGPRILNHCALALYQPIHHLFSLSLSQHYLPEEWRVHRITPIYKSGDKSSVTNYRPISLLSTLSKVLERIIYNAIIDFVTISISVWFLTKASNPTTAATISEQYC